MRKETPTYQADGLAMRSQLLLEHAPGPRAGVLVFPEIFGLGAHAIGRAERLAVLGHVALAHDLQQAMGLLQPLFANPSRTRSRTSEALRTLTARPGVDSARVAAIGCCFPTPLEFARSGADLTGCPGSGQHRRDRRRGHCRFRAHRRAGEQHRPRPPRRGEMRRTLPRCATGETGSKTV